MRIRKKIDFPLLFLYIACTVGMLCLFQIGNNHEPFAVAMLYGMICAGLSPIWSAFCFVIASLPAGEPLLYLLFIGQALLLAIAFVLQKRLQKEERLGTGILPLFALSVGLALFFTLAPFQNYFLPFEADFFSNEVQRVIIAALIFLFCALSAVAMKALVRKLLKCRLRDDEIVFSLLLLVLIGVGFCRFFSVNAYMGASFFILLLFACATKDASITVCAFILSLPPFLVVGISPARFFLYGIAITLFIKTGRLAAVCAFLSAFFIFGYLDGLFTSPTNLLVQAILSALLPSLFFILVPPPWVRAMENRLIFYRERHLSRIAINRNRSAIGEKLFEISTVFREIESTFHALNTNEAEVRAREYMLLCVTEETCAGCSKFELCTLKKGRESLKKLIEIGCMKGKINLIDLPRELAEVCPQQGALLHSLNQQLMEYRKYMLEAENAASGRAMLAKQAQGVSEILKNLALEQSEPLRLHADKERALNIALLSAGIVCSETLVYGEENDLTLSLITFGKANVKKIAAVASHILQAPMIISERLALSQDKFCCVLRKKPTFDAAFGVATAKKHGESASGDTHSVIKIDEGKFMVALSDGMGSGEYARQISESTISLLESFYRAKMPSELILSTVNKLLSFQKEETFACVDIAVVNLNSGNADIVKIGSPMGFILSGNTIRVLETSSLPLGILEAVRPDTSSYTLSANDILLFISDGVSDAFGSTADLYETLRTVPLNNPQQLVDCLLERALQAYGGKAKDDMTAVAVRLFKNLSM